MKSQSNKVQTACDVKVCIDGNSLRLSFPKRHTPLWEALDGKSLKGKPKYLYLTKYGFSANNPDDIKRASAIASQLEADLDHPEWEKLFDRSLAKYGLGGGKYAKLADIIQMPGTVQSLPEITVGAMWEEYLQWKKTTIEETTFSNAYNYYTNAVNGKVYQKSRFDFSQSEHPLSSINLDDKTEIIKALALISISAKSLLLAQLSKAFEYAQTKELLVNPTTANPFVLDKFSAPVVTTQQKYADKVVNGVTVEWHETNDETALENDRRSFSKVERDIIIKAFYESEKTCRLKLAPLIEFYFLTGCRTSEAIPLTWRDINFNKNLIVFNKSMGRRTKKVKDTKTGEARLFYFSDTSRLKALLLEIKADNIEGLVFPNNKGKCYNVGNFGYSWLGQRKTSVLATGEEVEYFFEGLIPELVKDGKIKGYLSLYHTRHTYITLTAQANSHNNNALLHIATSCGNSVDVILRHYLGVSESTELVEV
jgi:integrase